MQSRARQRAGRHKSGGGQPLHGRLRGNAVQRVPQRPARAQRVLEVVAQRGLRAAEVAESRIAHKKAARHVTAIRQG